jgi:hypothetical protein
MGMIRSLCRREVMADMMGGSRWGLCGDMNPIASYLPFNAPSTQNPLVSLDMVLPDYAKIACEIVSRQPRLMSSKVPNPMYVCKVWKGGSSYGYNDD